MSSLNMGLSVRLTVMRASLNFGRGFSITVNRRANIYGIRCSRERAAAPLTNINPTVV